MYSLSPVGSHYWVSVGEACLFSLPSLALWWEKLCLWWTQRLSPGGGGIMLYTIRSLLHRCCGSPSLNCRGTAFSRLENFWRDKDTPICQSLCVRMGRESVSVYVAWIQVKLQPYISFILLVFTKCNSFTESESALLKTSHIKLVLRCINQCNISTRVPWSDS